ncbi:MAG: hypothetical protein ACLR3T_00105 [Alistipes finegoldii]
MSDLVKWYNDEEQSAEMFTELAAVFHYRRIRIHPLRMVMDVLPVCW